MVAGHQTVMVRALEIGIVARRSFIDKKPATVENVNKALIEAEYFILSPRGRTQTVKTIINRLKLSDRNLAEEGYADIVKEFDAEPYPSLEKLKNMQRLVAMQNPKLADIDTARLTDSSFIRTMADFRNVPTKFNEGTHLITSESRRYLRQTTSDGRLAG